MNEKIWLIDMGDEIVWCNEPFPSEHIEEEDTTGYVRMDIHQTTINTLCDALDEASIWAEVDGHLDEARKYQAIVKQHKQE